MAVVGGTQTATSVPPPATVYQKKVRDYTEGRTTTPPPASGVTASPSGYDVDRFNQMSQAEARYELMNAANLGPNGQSAMNHHFGVETPDTAQLLLRASGYVGNTAADLSAQVARIHKSFADAGYDQGLTPGLVSDIIRARTGYGQKQISLIQAGMTAADALSSGGLGTKEWTGQHGNVIASNSGGDVKQQQLRDLLGLAIYNDFTSKVGKSKGDSVLADVSNVYTGQIYVGYALAGLKHPEKGDPAQTAALLAGTTSLGSNNAWNVAKASESLGKVGVDYSQLTGSYASIRRQLTAQLKVTGTETAAKGAGNTQLNASTADQRAALTQALSAQDATRQMQLGIIRAYPEIAKDASATGVINGNWPKILIALQGKQSYGLISKIANMQSAGYGNDLDPYSVVDVSTGKLTGPQAAHAHLELSRYHEAIKLRDHAVAAHPLGGDMWAAIPLGMYRKGGGRMILDHDFYGLSIDSTIAYIAGGNDHNFTFSNPGFSVHGGLAGIDQLAKGVLAVPHHSIGAITRTVKLGFDETNGIWLQAKRDMFASVALLPHIHKFNSKDSGLGAIPIVGDTLSKAITDTMNFSLAPILQPYATPNTSFSTRWDLAGQRLSDRSLQPTWLDIALNTPDGQKVLAGDMTGLGMDPRWAKITAAGTDVVSNMIADFLVTKDLGLSAVGDTKALLSTLGNVDRASLFVKRSADAQDALVSMWSHWSEGRYAEGFKSLGINNTDVVEKPAFIEIDGALHPIKPGDPLPPDAGPTPAELSPTDTPVTDSLPPDAAPPGEPVEPPSDIYVPGKEPDPAHPVDSAPADPKPEPVSGPADLLRDPVKVRALDKSGGLDAQVHDLLTEDNGFPTIKEGDAHITTHTTPVGKFSRVEMRPARPSVEDLAAHAEVKMREVEAEIQKTMPDVKIEHEHVYNTHESVRRYMPGSPEAGIPNKIVIRSPDIRDEATYNTFMHELGHATQVPHLPKSYFSMMHPEWDEAVYASHPDDWTGPLGNLNETFGTYERPGVPLSGGTLALMKLAEIKLAEKSLTVESHAWNWAIENGILPKDMELTHYATMKLDSYRNGMPFDQMLSNEHNLQFEAHAAEGQIAGFPSDTALGHTNLRVNPSGNAILTDVGAEAEIHGRNADLLAGHTLAEAKSQGARQLIPNIHGMDDRALALYKRMVALARKDDTGLYTVTEGEPIFARSPHTGLWGWEGGGRVHITNEISNPVEEAQKEAAAVSESDEYFDLHDTKEMEAVLNGDFSGKTYNVMEAVKSGKLKPEQLEDWLTQETANGSVFHNLQAGLPSRSTRMFNPGWDHPLGYVPHPLRVASNGFNKGFHLTMNTLERSFLESRVPGSTLGSHTVRELHVLFSRAANGNLLPLTEYDPENIQSAARELGLSNKYGEVLASLFSRARYNNDGALLQKIENTLRHAGYDQNRPKLELDNLVNAFSGRVDRSGEHLHYTNPKTLFADDGPLNTRQWAAISAAKEGMGPNELVAEHRRLGDTLKAMGLKPQEARGVYKGNEELSWFVPGLRQGEALKLGGDFGQESVMTTKGLLHTARGDKESPLYGKLQPRTTGPTKGRIASVKAGEGVKPVEGYTPVKKLTAAEARKSDGYTEIKVKGRTVRFARDVQDGFDSSGHELSSLPHGEVKFQTNYDAVKRELEALPPDAEPEARAALEEQLANASKTPTPQFTTEMYHNFSLPILNVGRRSGMLGVLNDINGRLLQYSAVSRRLLLVADPILFWKHASADTMRRLIGSANTAQGLGILRNGEAKKELAEFHAANPRAAAMADETSWKNISGELRYNTDIKPVGRTTTKGFWTGPKNDAYERKQAADYLHRRVLDGAYQAYREGGIEGAINFFRTDARGMRLVKDQDMTPEMMGKLVGQNIETIHGADPTFLDELQNVVDASKKGDTRTAIAKWLKKNEDRSVPVTGHVNVDDVNNLTLRARADQISQMIIKGYMAANKLNKGGMFNDVLASTFKAMKDAGVEPLLAHENAVGVANQAVKFHLLDLADALKVEQTFRWADYFFTKHRLYWSWLGHVVANNPEYAIALKDFQGALEKTGNHNGLLTINLGKNALGEALHTEGGQLSYTIPLARLFWLDTTSSELPGPFSVIASDLASGNAADILPYQQGSNVDATTIDTSIKYASMLVLGKFGHTWNSEAVESHLNPRDAYAFKKTYWRVYAGIIASGDGKGLTGQEIDEMATHTTMVAEFTKSGWRRSGFTGGYVEDPTHTTAQERILAKYFNEPDPAARAKLRGDFPFIAQELGMYNQTAADHVKSNKAWDNFNKMMDDHHLRQDALLAEFKRTGNPATLFGPAWTAEGDRFRNSFNLWKRENSATAATAFSAQAEKDRMLPTWAAFNEQLHKAFPLYSDAQVSHVVAEQETRSNRVSAAQRALDGPYSKEAIAKLPPDLQQSAQLIRYHYEDIAYSKMDAAATPDQAEVVRDKYYAQVYTPYQNKIGKLYDSLGHGTDPSVDAQIFSKIRSLQDASNRPHKLGGFTFPGPEEISWLNKPKAAQTAALQKLSVTPWAYLTRFQKNLMGVHVDEKTQKGWDVYNNVYYGAKIKYAKQNGGSSLYIDDGQKLGLAQEVDKLHPGFLKDFVRSQQPTWYRGLSNVGIYSQGNAGAAKAWKELFRQVGAGANQQGGVSAIPANDGAKLMAYNALIRKQSFQQILTGGIAGSDNGIPWATGPNSKYPTGGWYYRWAQRQNPVFRKQFNAQMAADPQFVLTLFGLGG